MRGYPGEYAIRIQGSLHPRWQDWFEGATFTPQTDGTLLLFGTVQDQSALVGIINQIHNLNLKLISVNVFHQDSPS